MKKLPRLQYNTLHPQGYEFQFHIGDEVIYNIELMKKNGYARDQYDKRTHKVCSVEYHDGLGEIVGWWTSKNKYLPDQCNAVWLKRISENKEKSIEE